MKTESARLRHLGVEHYRLEAAAGRVMHDTAVAMSVILGAIASRTHVTRPNLVRETGLSPTLVNGHVEELIRRGIIAPGGQAKPVGRGRPAETLVIRADAGCVLVASVTASHVELAVVTLNQERVAFESHAIDVADGPSSVLRLIIDRLRTMVASSAISRVLLVSVGLPGPVDSRQGVPVRPPIMPGWDGHPVAGLLSDEFDCAVVVDNDVNLMALGESRALPPSELPLLFLKVGTGIGGGLVTADGVLHRGAHGAAGDVGHIRAPGEGDQICSCGNVNCLEAVASVAAMTRLMRDETGDDTWDQARFIAAVHAGDARATRIVRLGAVTLGEAAAMLVHLYNPARIAIGGPLTDASDDLLAGIRSVVYQRALPLATRNLTLAHATLGREAAIVGASIAAIETVLSDAFIREHLLVS